MIKVVVLGAVVALIVASIVTDWPWGHTFHTYGWPGPFGWVATNTPGNMVAGFLQVGIGFCIGYGFKKAGLLDRAKHWLTRDLHTEVARSHELMHHIIEHHPDIPNVPHRKDQHGR